MRTPWLLVPIAYIAGVHGFALFAPYLGLFLAAAHVLRRRHPSPLRPATTQAATIPTFQM